MGAASAVHEHQPLLSQQAGIKENGTNGFDYAEGARDSADNPHAEEGIREQSMLQQQQQQHQEQGKEEEEERDGSMAMTRVSAASVADVDVSSMTVREQLAYLWATIRQPGILHPTLFIFLWQISPSSESAMFFFT